MENPGAKIRGIYRDQLFNEDKQLKFDSGWNSNTIMDSFHELLAQFVMLDKDVDSTKDCLVMRVAIGDPAWDQPEKLIPPQPGDEDLIKPYNGFLLKERDTGDVLVWEYLDSTQKPQGKKPSHAVLITATLNPDTPVANTVCNLREFAIYLQLGDQEFIINHVRHPLIAKAPTDTLIRQVQFTF